jgi:pimeloyl-ACP methyl ester carboxylesterase
MRVRSAARSVAAMSTQVLTPTRLEVHEAGRPDGPPLLFIHGWSQCQLCWSRQFAGPLAERFRLVSFDLRGHGMSEAPADASAYTDSRGWADDVAAVIDALDLDGVVAVAWSYGGMVVTDYIREHGADRLAGINLVGAAVQTGPAAGPLFGPGLVDNVQDLCSPDLDRAIPALQRFLRACTAEPLPEEELRRALCWNMVVRPDVRAAVLGRDLDAGDVLASLTIPVLVTQGTADRIVLASMADYALERCPTASASWYEGIGHAPFLEAPERFDRELGDFAAAADRPR